MLLEMEDVKMDEEIERDPCAFRLAMLINVAFWFLIVLPWFIFT
jgi:hypothetical protein